MDVKAYDESRFVKLPKTKQEIIEREKKPDFFDQLTEMRTNRLKKHFKNPIDVDYNMSRCKDFHDAGYCSWGQSCIYAHDRTDYKRGWELDKEWEEKQKEMDKKGLQAYSQRKSNSEEEKDNTVQIICGICDKQAEDPVIAECKHIFCESCILKEFAKSKVCPVCKKKIQGNFVNYTQSN